MDDSNVKLSTIIKDAMLEVFQLLQCNVVNLCRLVCRIVCWSKSTVCEKPRQKNGHIAAFNTHFVRINYTSNMAACCQ